jgi:hypothetical protein
MSTVCDVEPCETMARAIGQLTKISDEHPHFEFMVTHKKGMVVRVTLVYCPFCGTRVDERWVDEVRNRGRLVR